MGDIERALQDPQAALEQIEEMEARKHIARASRAVERAQELIRRSQDLMATERKLLAQWRSRRQRVRERLAYGPRRAEALAAKLPQAA